MDKNILVGKFECCGNMMVAVIIKGRSACIMPELEYKMIIMTEPKFRNKNRLKELA